MNSSVAAPSAVTLCEGWTAVAATTPTRRRAKATLRGTRLGAAAALLVLALSSLAALNFGAGPATQTAIAGCHFWQVGCRVTESLCPTIGNRSLDDANASDIGLLEGSAASAASPPLAAVSLLGNDLGGTGVGSLYAYYGDSGLNWTYYNVGCDFPAMIGNYFANIVFDLPKLLGSITFRLFAASVDSSNFNGVVNSIHTFIAGGQGITGLVKAIYTRWLPVMLLLAALWLVWAGVVRRQATQTLQGMLWIVASMTFALTFFAYSTQVAKWGNHAVDQLGSDAFNSLSASQDTSGSYANAAANELYSELLLTPWAQGQFGLAPDAIPTGKSGPVTVKGIQGEPPYNGHGWNADRLPPAVAYLDASVIGADQADFANQKQGDSDGTDDSYEWDRVQLAVQDDPSVYTTWQGRDWGSRVAIAFLALVACLVVIPLVVVVAVASLAYMFAMIVLIVLSPLVLLAGVHPGLGRNVALRWAEMLIATVAKRILLAVMLAVTMALYGVIFDAPSIGWFLKILFCAALGIAALMYRRPFLETFGVVNLGGGSGGHLGQYENHAHGGARMLAAAGVGAVAGGTTAAGVGLGGRLLAAGRGGMAGARSSRTGGFSGPLDVGTRHGRATAARAESQRRQEQAEQQRQEAADRSASSRAESQQRRLHSASLSPHELEDAFRAVFGAELGERMLLQFHQDLQRWSQGDRSPIEVPEPVRRLRAGSQISADPGIQAAFEQVLEADKTRRRHDPALKDARDAGKAWAGAGAPQPRTPSPTSSVPTPSPAPVPVAAGAAAAPAPSAAAPSPRAVPERTVRDLLDDAWAGAKSWQARDASRRGEHTDPNAPVVGKLNEVLDEMKRTRRDQNRRRK